MKLSEAADGTPVELLGDALLNMLVSVIMVEAKTLPTAIELAGEYFDGIIGALKDNWGNRTKKS